jgi:hypothetical protein
VARSSHQAFQRIFDLHFPTAQTAVDATHGKGVFWKGINVKVIGCDLNRDRAKDVISDCRFLPFRAEAFDVGVIDLPFMHDTSPHNGTGLYECYRGVGDWQRFVGLTVAGARELQRVCQQGVIVKCKDGIEAGRYRPIMAALVAELGVPVDMLLFVPDVTLQNDPKWKGVHHFRRKESYFLVYAADKVATPRSHIKYHVQPNPAKKLQGNRA